MSISYSQFYTIVLCFVFLYIFGGTLTGNVFGQSESAQFPALRKQQFDCDYIKAVNSMCRVKRVPLIASLQSRLSKGETSWRDGSEVVFAFQSAGDTVTLNPAGDSWAMARLRGTDFWVLVLKVPEYERAVISYQFMVSKGEDIKIEPQTPLVWRGFNAPPSPRKATVLQGRLTEEFIQSSNLSESRSLTVYAPPFRKGEQIAAAVYLADGRSVRLIAPYIDSLIVSRRLPPVLLVGVHYGKILPGNDPQVSDTRALEYLIGFGKTDARFEAHERFFINEVVPWAESKFDVPKTSDKRAVFGASNSGSFALAMGIKHPEIFGHVIAFSPTWSKNLSPPSWTRENSPSHYLLVGTLESNSTRKLVKGWAETANKSGAIVNLREPVAGHDSVVWREWFGDALLTEFGKTKLRPRRSTF